MKTSNKILLTFLILVFATPFFLFMSFRNKITKGQFTESVAFNNQYRRSDLLAPIKVLKVVGPATPDVMSCHLIPADSSWYAYNKYGFTDSIQVEHRGDTLLLQYVDTDIQENNGTVRSEKVHLRIDLYAPAITDVVVEGATIVMDSVNAVLNSGINFDLRDQALLSLGTSGQVRTTQVNNTTLTESSSPLFNKVVIKALFSSVKLGQFAKVKDLHLQLQGASSVSVDNNSQIDQLDGFLSDSSTVEANWKNIRRLAALTHE